MKHIKKFNEELSVDNPENFDSEETTVQYSCPLAPFKVAPSNDN